MTSKNLNDDVPHRNIQALLDLRGKIDIDYDWEDEERRELKLNEPAIFECTITPEAP